MKLSTMLAIIVGLFVLVAVFMPVYACGCGKQVARRTACLSNVKEQALGHLMYANDHDDRFPNRDYWMDSIMPYVKNVDLLHEPGSPKGTYGYAFNANLSQVKPPNNAEKVPLVYESVDPIWNASDRVASLSAVGKHQGKNNLAYADGHSRAIPAGKVP